MSNAKLRQYAVEQLLTACRESANFLGMDLEEYRITAILTYDQLAEMIGVKSVSQMRRLCIGAELLRDLRLEKAIEISGGAVTAFAVHRRRMTWLREHGRNRFDLSDCDERADVG